MTNFNPKVPEHEPEKLHHPGEEFIKNIIIQGISWDKISEILGVNKNDIYSIIFSENITVKIAGEYERLTGVSKEKWIERSQKYNKNKLLYLLNNPHLYSTDSNTCRH